MLTNLYAIMKKLSVILFAVLFLTSCARDLDSDVYTADSTLSLTMEGKIINVRVVTIKNSDRLGNNSTGTLGGAALGGLAGSGMGKGKGAYAGAIGGAIAGGVAGAAIEGQLGKQQGYEYIIKVDTSKLKFDHFEGTKIMRDAISSATTSGMVTVIQGRDVKLQKGQKVYVIFSDKRARVIAAD
ncbi:MAG: glycine zipper 2TM domain-containing protein [Rickettsiales bacterium]